MMHPVHNVNDGKFNTASGKIIDLHNPDPTTICIVDIASALSKICRFGGHLNTFYSVAQHSCLVYEMAPPQYKLLALLHDASEAYLGDIIKPLKVLIESAYSEIETRFDVAICEKFNVPYHDLLTIKAYDKEACEIEHLTFQQGSKDGLKRLARYFGSSAAWSLSRAEKEFIKRFKLHYNEPF